MGLNDKSSGTRIKMTMGKRLSLLRQYSGLSLAEVAQRGGYKGASSVQKLFHPAYDPAFLPTEVASKLAKAFVGTGDPPIRPEELAGLTENAQEIDTLVADLSYLVHVNSDKIALFHTQKMNDVVVTNQGHEIPLFVRCENKNGDYIPCPIHLRPKQIVGQYVSVGNMWPRFEEGEILFYEHRTPPVAGDDVVVTLVSEEDIDGGMIVGRLVLLTDDEVRLAILSPRDTVVLTRKQVIAIRRLTRTLDLLDPPRSVI